MRSAFFPPRSGKAHQLPEPHPSAPHAAIASTKNAVFVGAIRANALVRFSTHEQAALLAHLWQFLVGLAQLLMVAAAFSQRPYLKVASSIDHSFCNDRQSTTRFVALLVVRFSGSAGISDLRDAIASLAIWC